LSTGSGTSPSNALCAHLFVHLTAAKHLAAADTDLATARNLWRPTRSDPYGDLDRPAAELAMRRGRLDLAETLAAASVRRWRAAA
jgi:hypothetical protein